MNVSMSRAIKLWIAVIGLALTLTVSPLFSECRKTILYNGKITTMDPKNPLASWITIEDDRITAVGTSGIPKHHGCARLINLKGRRVVPGLIDSHNHIVVVSLRPGHDVRLDTVSSIPELQKLLHDRTTGLAPGSWITSIGGWSPEQLSEGRMPTQAELDVASSDYPIYLQTGFDGPAVANSKGKIFFESKEIKVSDDGSIAANVPTVAAFNALKSLQTVEDKKQGALDVMAYAASVGLTMSDDKGGTWPLDTPGAEGIAEVGNRTNVLNPYLDYDPFLALDRAGRMTMRLRIFFYMQDLHADLPFLHARLDNQFPDFGDDWLRVSGIGERIYSGPFPFVAHSSPDIYLLASRLIARKGWAHDEHAMGLADEKVFADIWEKVNTETPLAPLRWCLAHVPGIDEQTLLRLKAIGVGVSAAGGRYTASNPPRNSPKDIPPFRLLVESGIHVGYGSDGGTVSALNPWVHMYYMVTGKNSAGQLVAAGQTISRLQALQMYTVNQPWFTKDEEKLGSLEVGKLADLVVLNKDFMDPNSVSDDAIKQIRSVLTIVGGKVVHDSGAVQATGNEERKK